jgi:hypothetical protein
MIEKKKFEITKRLVKADGTIAYLWEGKLHSMEGPALIPCGDKKRREYYIHGIPYTEQKWKEACKNREGLPWYKNPTLRGGNR